VSGIVLLVLIGIGAAWLVTGGRKKLRLPTTGKHWIWIVIVVVIVLALVYGASTSPHSAVGH
jgi:hypothetical protein